MARFLWTVVILFNKVLPDSNKKETSQRVGKNTKFPLARLVLVSNTHAFGLLSAFVLASGMAERNALSVDNLSVFVAVLVDERLVILSHATQRHTHV